ncbi:MAG: DNA gyrase subunit A [Euryarchaeota archaeon]|nr:DNA gyrase subunit A [Euryarchaeota archaeon]
MTSEDDDNMEEESQNPTDIQIPKSIDEEMKNSYINYAMSVIIGRALPDVRDGLKPVHRRILYGMYEGGHTSEKSFSKSARSVGEVMGKYHPHGDQSIYDTMVRLSQEFSLRYPLIDGQGNFGSIDGDPPAAMRYTESRLDKIAKHMLGDIEKNTVVFQPNFDDSENEPTVLPARLPNLLLNGSDGIAVGMATKIPPHNLREVSSAINLHVAKIIEEGVENNPSIAPAISVEEYMQHITGPDFPTGANIFGIDGIADMYATGHGRFHVRATCDVEDDDKGKRIVITEIPYQVKKGPMLEGIADLVSKETVKGIRDIRDESSKEGIRVVIEVKQNADPHAVLNQLYRSSRLQESYSANMMGVLENQPILLTLSKMLHTYVRHREDVIERRTQFELDKAQRRAHILEGLVKAQDRIDDVIKAGRGSESREQFERILRGEEDFPGVDTFDFSIPQAKAIAERRLYQLSRLDVRKVQDEYDELQVVINELSDILASRERRLNILTTELNEMVEKHGDDRRSIIDPMPLSMDREDLIAERALVISLSDDGYIRHTPAESFRVQKRKGKGLKGVTTKDEDTPKAIITCFSKDRLLIFTDQGRVYGLRAWETPQASRLSRGTHIRNLIERIREDENVVTILPISRDLIDNPDDHFLLFSTIKGLIKKTKLSEYVKINRNGKYALRFKIDEDRLVNVRHGTNDDDILIYTSNGLAARFLCSKIRASGRVSAGVFGIRFKVEGDTVVGMLVTANPETQILTITKYGMGKRTELGTADRLPMLDSEGNQKIDSKGELAFYTDGYRRTNPGGKGVVTMKLNEGDEVVSVRQIPDLGDQIFLLTKKGMMIRIKAGETAITKGRSSKGTMVMELRDKAKGGYSDSIIFTARLPADLVDDDDEDNGEAGMEAPEGIVAADSEEE